MNISKLQTDDTRAVEGVWLDFSDDVRVRVAYCEKSTAYKRALAREMRRHRQAELQRRPELAEACVTLAMEKVLLEWEGFTEGEADTPLAVNDANRRKLLAIPEFRDWLARETHNADNFSTGALAEDAEALKSRGSVGA